ncbi:MAG: 3-oxoacyl-ACP synthase [Bdellovibrionaceae bacterium]|nr:3-oxoacyl-ACP synthase [Pseudobdellovibrionaceae bacterium]
MHHSWISGIGSAHPKGIVTNEELAKKIAQHGAETNDQWIRERTGICERRISSLKEDERNSSLGLRASLEAMEMANIQPQDIDLILYATCSPDTLVPSTACWLQKKLGALQAGALDLNAACSGFVYGLHLADQMIKTGAHKTILVIGGEVLSPYLNWGDRTSSILFGDGAGAAVVQRTHSDQSSRLFSTHVGSDGNLWDLFYIPAGGSNQEVTPEVYERQEHKMKMKGREIFKVACNTLATYAKKAIESNEFSVEDVDWIVPHQANLRIIENVAKKLNVPMDKVIVNVDRFGNTSAATVPTAFAEAVKTGKIKRGDLVLFDVFGAGLTYGSALLRW